MNATPRRKYALTHVKAGDYILPGNDGRTLWRIATLIEGPSTGVEGMTRDQQFWGIWRWPEAIREGSYIDIDSWDSWEHVEGWHETRQSAIESALRMSRGNLKLMQRLISLRSPNVVFDPFAGSGSTLEAAKRLGVRAIGIELEARYCALVAHRCAQEVLVA